MRHIDPAKINELKTVNAMLDEKYGQSGTLSRKQSYIARIENGKADIQLSSVFTT